MDKEELKKQIFELIEKSEGKKKNKAGDIMKKFADEASRAEIKEAIRELVDAGTITYAYLGGSYLVLPPKE